METFVIIVIVIISIAIYAIIEDKQIKQKQAEEQRKEQLKEQRRQKRKNDIELIKQFAKNNNSSIDYLLEKRDQLYSNALTKWATGKLTQPVRPTTVSPVYKGNALANYTADKINKERQDSYYNSLSGCNDMMNEGLKLHREAQKRESEILKTLGNLPESKAYVEMLQRYFAEDSKVFNIK